MPDWISIFKNGENISENDSGVVQLRPTDREIAAFERRFSLQLPRDFVNFLQVVNGVNVGGMWNRFWTFQELELIVLSPISELRTTVLFYDSWLRMNHVGLRFQNGAFRGVYFERCFDVRLAAPTFTDFVELLTRHGFDVDDAEYATRENT